MNLGERGIGREGLRGEEDGKLRSGCNVREELKKKKFKTMDYSLAFLWLLLRFSLTGTQWAGDAL